MTTPTYQQPIKEEVRRVMLRRAVEALTTHRGRAAVVTAGEFDETLEYAISFLERYNLCRPQLRSEATHQALDWHAFHKATVGTKRPSELRVLYLCGPEPQNDLAVLLELGVIPQNIWAIESSAKVYQHAVAQLRQLGQYIRIHHGSLETFFDATNERFDIVYVDACGALLCGHPNTVMAPLLMFHRERLAEIGALVTNFSQPPVERCESYTQLMCNYFAPRYNDFPRALFNAGADPALAAPEPSYLLKFVRANFDDVYADFVTRFLVDLGREIVPYSRIYDNRDVRNKYFSATTELRKVLARAIAGPPDKRDEETVEEHHARFFSEMGDLFLNSSGYPVFRFLQTTAQDKSLEHFSQALFGYKLRAETIWRSFPYVALLAKVIEGHWAAASPEMQAAVRQSWFDSRGGIFCDVPLPNLMINSLFGIYGHPYLPNPRLSARLHYTAKQTKMYMDLLVLDQCRYFFDYLPTIDLIPDRFRSQSFQLVVRTCLDRMGRHDFSSSSHPFHGAALAGFGDTTSGGPYDYAPRVEGSDVLDGSEYEQAEKDAEGA